MDIKTVFYCTLQLDGLHYDPDADGRFNFQSQIHRHTFTIKAYSLTTNASALKLMISDHLRKSYYDSIDGYHAFGTNLCNDIAIELMEEFDLIRCEVDADGNGAIVYGHDTKFGVKGSMVFVPDDEDGGIVVP